MLPKCAISIYLWNRTKSVLELDIPVLTITWHLAERMLPGVADKTHLRYTLKRGRILAAIA